MTGHDDDRGQDDPWLPIGAAAQTGDKVYRVGFLTIASGPATVAERTKSLPETYAEARTPFNSGRWGPL